MFSEYIIIEESLNGNNFIAMFYDQPEITYQNFYKKLKELDLEGEGNEFSFLVRNGITTAFFIRSELIS